MYKTIFSTAEILVEDFILNYQDIDRFIVFCKQCNQYNKCWACPPYDFDATEQLSSYDYVSVIGTQIIFDEELKRNSQSAEKTQILTRKILAEVRKSLDDNLLILETQYSGSRAFFAGTCFNCPNGECTRPEKIPCTQNNKLRYSLEAFGFDISRAVSELLGIELKWNNDGFLPEYFTLISGFFTTHQVGKEMKALNWL